VDQPLAAIGDSGEAEGGVVFIEILHVLASMDCIHLLPYAFKTIFIIVSSLRFFNLN